MDGIGYVSQCPIASGQSFTYQFKVSEIILTQLIFKCKNSAWEHVKEPGSVWCKSEI